MSALLPLGLLASAWGVELSLGPTVAINDPYLRNLGVTESIGFPIGQTLVVALQGTAYPDLGRHMWTQVHRHLVDDNHLSADLSLRVFDVSAAVALVPLRTDVGRFQTALGAYVGGGVVRTADDLESFRAEGDPLALRTELQLHPMLVYGVYGDLVPARGPGLRVRLNEADHVEAVGGDVLEMKLTVLLSVELLFRLGSPARVAAAEGAP